MSKGFIFYSSFYEALRDLDDADRLACYDAICAYALEDIEPQAGGIVGIVFKLIRPQIDANAERRENGKRGGRPKKAEDTESENHRLLKEKTNGYEFEKPKEKVKVKDKVKDKEKVKEKYGEYKHVSLSPKEYQKLVDDFGEVIAKKAIKEVDEYCETSGKRYQNYNLVIRKWGVERAKGQRAAPGYKNRYNDFPQRDNDYQQIQEDWIRSQFGK